MSESIETHTILPSLLETLSPQLCRSYTRGINKDLAKHHLEGLFQRNIISTVKQGYHQIRLSTPVSESDLPIIEGWVDGLVEYALEHHRSSCALSNFPSEHNPDQQYINQTLQLLQKEWQAFTTDLKL